MHTVGLTMLDILLSQGSCAYEVFPFMNAAAGKSGLVSKVTYLVACRASC